MVNHRWRRANRPTPRRLHPRVWRPRDCHRRCWLHLAIRRMGVRHAGLAGPHARPSVYRRPRPRRRGPRLRSRLSLASSRGSGTRPTGAMRALVASHQRWWRVLGSSSSPLARSSGASPTARSGPAWPTGSSACTPPPIRPCAAADAPAPTSFSRSAAACSASPLAPATRGGDARGRSAHPRARGATRGTEDHAGMMAGIADLGALEAVQASSAAPLPSASKAEHGGIRGALTNDVASFRAEANKFAPWVR